MPLYAIFHLYCTGFLVKVIQEHHGEKERVRKKEQEWERRRGILHSQSTNRVVLSHALSNILIMACASVLISICCPRSSHLFIDRFSVLKDLENGYLMKVSTESTLFYF